MQKTVPNYPPSTLLNPLKDAEFDGLYNRLNSVETLLEKKKRTWRVDKIPPSFSKTAI